MVPLTQLWLPIVVASVLVFLVSWILHMLLKYHQADYKPFPEDEALLAGLRKADLAPGVYVVPHCTDHKQMGSPEMQAKYKAGPVGMYTAMAKGLPNMGKYLGTWFFYCLLVSFFTAYLTGHTLGPDKDYLAVFRVAGTAAFMAYGLSAMVDSIWKSVPWSNTCRAMFDGLVYALVTAGAFGWLWPR